VASLVDILKASAGVIPTKFDVNVKLTKQAKIDLGKLALGSAFATAILIVIGLKISEE